MTLALSELKTSYAFVERNMNLVKRYWGWEVVWVLYTIANSLAVVLIARGANDAAGISSGGGFSEAEVNHLILFLAIGALVWHYLAVVFQTVSEMITWERWEGTIEYTFMAPVRRGTHMVGTALFSLIYGLLHTAVVLVVVVLVFKLDMNNANYVSATAVLVCGTLSLVGIGIMGAVLPLLYPERGMEMTHVIQAALVLFSGIYIAADKMPEPLATISIFSPARYVIEGIRSALIDGDGFGALWPTMVGLVVSGIVLIPVGVYVFSLGERYAKRTGRLKRSG
jgi:ABC-2 type transport system permease protein